MTSDAIRIIPVFVGMALFSPISCVTNMFQTFCTDFKHLELKDPKLGYFDNEFEVLKTECLPIIPLARKNYPTVYGIKGDKHNLSNWIHYKLPIEAMQITDDHSTIFGLIIQADSDEFAGFGQFVPFPFYNVSQPPYSDGSLAMPPYEGNDKPPYPTQFFPCTFRQSVEPLPPSVFIFTEKGRNKKIQIDENNDGKPDRTVYLANALPKTLHLLWKFSQEVCNNPKTVTFRGAIIKRDVILKKSEKGKPPVLAHKLGFIAYLIPPIRVTLAQNYSTAGSSPSVYPEVVKDWYVDLTQERWVKKVEVGPDLDNKINFPNAECDYKQPPNPNPPIPPAPSQPLDPNFFGCGKDLPGCKSPPNGKLNNRALYYQDYADYVNHRLKFNCYCPRPHRIAESEPDIISKLSNKLVYPLDPLTAQQRKRKKGNRTESAPRGTKEQGVSVLDFPGDDVWNFRVIHGVAFASSGLFVTPFSIFITRHYKETFMRSQILYNKPWFIVHLLSVLLNFFLIACGMFAILLARLLLGVSKNNKSEFFLQTNCHGLIGFGNIGVFLLLTVFGGLRAYNPCMRKIWIFLHWALGMAYYWSTLYLILLSINIGGSPSFGGHDKSADTNFEKYIVAILIFSWLTADISFHIVMDVFRWWYDHSLGIRRKHRWIVPIPVLNDYNRTDIPGGIIRKLVLLSYLLTALGFCSFVIYFIAYPVSDTSRGFGLMSCSHKFTYTGNSTNLSASSTSACKFRALPFNVSPIATSIPLKQKWNWKI